jgi:phospholipid/cholesterol/gamma-HCH transport system substrate-binding protein
MQPSPIRDLIVGLFVLAGLAALAYLSIQVGGLSYKGPGGFELVATFDEIGGLATRAPVAISGVKVGQVSRIELAPDLRARVTLDLDSSLKLPIDTSAAIRTSGLLGDQFIALEPGAEETLLKSGEEIDRTESALSLERLIGKFVNNAGLDDTEKKDGEKK